MLLKERAEKVEIYRERLTYAWEASKGVIGEGHRPLVLEERWWRWCRDVEDRTSRDIRRRVG